MTILELCERYDLMAAPLCRTRAQAPEDFHFTDRLIQVEHIRWMLLQIPELPQGKAMRWLSFVQGVLWGKGAISIRECRKDTAMVLQQLGFR